VTATRCRPYFFTGSLDTFAASGGVIHGVSMQTYEIEVYRDGR
jgi:hypothetical protein